MRFPSLMDDFQLQHKFSAEQPSVEFSSIEMELGAFLLLFPSHYKDLETFLLKYQPSTHLLSILLQSFRSAIEKDGSPQFVDKYLPHSVHQIWLEYVNRARHLIDLSLLPKLRKYLENEVRNQELRQCVEALRNAFERGAPEREIKEIFNRIQLLFFSGERGLYLIDIPKLLESLRDEKVRPKSIPFPFLQDVFSFPVDIFHKDITVVMGRTGRGKTTMALNIAKEYLLNDKVVCYITTEMDEQAIATKFASVVSGVSWSTLWGRDFDENNALLAASKVESLTKDGGLYIYHAPACTVSDISYAVSLCRANYGRVDAVILDYIQQVMSGYYRGEDTRAAELARIVREFADIVVENSAAGIVISQVNAQGEVKDSKAVAERAALLIRLGMLDFKDFVKYVLQMLKLPQDVTITSDKREKLRSIYRQWLDVEVVKNRYGAHSAGQKGFLVWVPETGQIVSAVSQPEFHQTMEKILLGNDIPQQTPKRKKSEKGKKGEMELPSYAPELPNTSLGDIMDMDDDSVDIDEFPF